MKYLMIQNAGELDQRAITLVGASSKRDSNEAIGMFGSGFSYTVGTLLREQLDFHIYSGEQEIAIETRPENFRGVPINVIYVNGERTSLTAEIGPKWTEVECVREVWSNAVDEGGDWWTVVDECRGGQPETTTIYIEVSHAIQTMIDTWERFFIHKDETPLYANKHGSIFAPTGIRPVGYYRRGVWCTEDTLWSPVFVYNLQDVNLPESRTISTSAALWHLDELLSECDSWEVAKGLLAAAGKTGVHEMPRINANSPMADTLNRLLEEQGIQYIGVEALRNRVTAEIAAVTFWVRDSRTASELRMIVGIPDVLTAITARKPYKDRAPKAGEQYMVNTMVATLKKAGIDMSHIPVVFGTFYEDVIALADMKENFIILSEEATKTKKMLFKALIEEYLHIEFRVSDFTVEQQHAYLDLLWKAVRL